LLRGLLVLAFQPLGVGVFLLDNRLGPRLHLFLRQPVLFAQLIGSHLQPGFRLAQIRRLLGILLLRFRQLSLLRGHFAVQGIAPDQPANGGQQCNGDRAQQRAGVSSRGFFNFTHSLPFVLRGLFRANPPGVRVGI